MKRLHFVALASALLLAPALADAKLGGATSSAVSFNAVGPGGMKIVGNTGDLSVAEDGDKVTVSVPLANLSTGIALRDKHMREKYLEIGKYPTAELTVSRSALKIPASGEASSTAQGALKLHGQRKDVTFTYTAKRDGGAFAVSGSVRVNMKEHGIEVPTYLGVTVKPEVDVSVRFQVKDN